MISSIVGNDVLACMKTVDMNRLSTLKHSILLAYLLTDGGFVSLDLSSDPILVLAAPALEEPGYHRRERATSHQYLDVCTLWDMGCLVL